MFLRSIPLMLSFLLLGAHFLRAENLVLTGVCFCFPLLLLVRRRWSVQMLQLLLYLGAAVPQWCRNIILPGGHRMIRFQKKKSE